MILSVLLVKTELLVENKRFIFITLHLVLVQLKSIIFNDNMIMKIVGRRKIELYENIDTC